MHLHRKDQTFQTTIDTQIIDTRFQHPKDLWWSEAQSHCNKFLTGQLWTIAPGRIGTASVYQLRISFIQRTNKELMMDMPTTMGMLIVKLVSYLPLEK